MNRAMTEMTADRAAELGAEIPGEDAGVAGGVREFGLHQRKRSRDAVGDAGVRIAQAVDRRREFRTRGAEFGGPGGKEGGSVAQPGLVELLAKAFGNGLRIEALRDFGDAVRRLRET